MANIFDLSAEEFRAVLPELASQGVDTDALVREYRRKNSALAPVYGLIDRVRGGDAEAGRERANILPMTRPVGTTGLEALLSGEAELAVPGALLGAAEGAAMGVDAPAAASRGLIPMADAPMEALGTAGSAMLGGGAAAGRGVFDYDPNVPRAIYGGSVDDALSLAKSGDAIFHSGNASIADDIHKYGVEPTSTGAWVSEVAAGAVDDVEEFLSQNPPAAWWADAPDWVKATTARAAGKHVSDLTDEDIRKFGHLSIARGSDWGDEVFRIPEEGLDNGEYSYVTDLLGDRIRLYETPLYQHGDDGVGRYPFGIERNELVTSTTIDPEFTLTGDELVDFLSRYNTTYANRDATTGAIALPAARNEAERMARDILKLRATGRASEVTDEMIAQADPQYMFDNTPLPMDYESRMGRAIQQGFDVNDEMYRGDAPLQSFMTGRGQRDQIGVTGSSRPDVAASYIPPRGEGGIYPLVSRGQNDAIIDAQGQNWNVIRPETEVEFQGDISPLGDYLPEDYFEPYDVLAGTDFVDTNDLSRMFQGYGADRVKFTDLVDRGGSAKYYGPESSMPSDVTMVANPTNVRSRFARFDPEFSHLANLSAANASPGVGLLQMYQQQQLEERARRRGLLP